jgi:hypothetical protein
LSARDFLGSTITKNRETKRIPKGGDYETSINNGNSGIGGNGRLGRGTS